jgi:hypothetical protein
MAFLTFRLSFFLVNGTSKDVLVGSFSPNVNIEAFYRGGLAIRPMDRDLYTPVGKFSRVPDEWQLISSSLEEA